MTDDDKNVPFEPEDDDAPAGDTDDHAVDADEHGGSGSPQGNQRGQGTATSGEQQPGHYKHGIVGGEAESDQTLPVGEPPKPDA